MKRANLVLRGAVVSVIVATAGLIAALLIGASFSPSTDNIVGSAVPRIESDLGITSDRIPAISENGQNLRVAIRGADPGDLAVSRWYGKVLGRETAYEVAKAGTEPITTISYDDSGANINGGSDLVTELPPTTPLPRDACATIGHSNPSDAMKITDVKGIDALQGGCVFTITPKGNISAFLRDAGLHLNSIITSIPDAQAHPYLVNVVDANGRTQLVVGWIPGIDGEIGEGIGWIQPGEQSSAIHGSMSRKAISQI
jgi:hypothetical protein